MERPRSVITEVGRVKAAALSLPAARCCGLANKHASQIATRRLCTLEGQYVAAKSARITAAALARPSR